MLLTLRSKILAGYLFLVLLLSALGIYSAISFRAFTTLSSGAYERISEADRINLGIYESLVKLTDAELQVLSTTSHIGFQTISDEPANISNKFTQEEKIVSEIPRDLAPALAPAFTTSEARWNEYQAQLPEFIKRVNTDAARARRFYDAVLLPTYTELSQKNRDVAATINDLFSRTRTLASEESSTEVRTVLIFTFAAVLIGILGSLLIVRLTTKPLRDLSTSLKSVRAGNLSSRLSVGGADELGEVSFEFNRMAERLQRYESMNIDRILAEQSKSVSAIESFSDPLFMLDAEGRVTLANHSAEEMLGRSEGEMRENRVSDLFPSMMIRAKISLAEKSSVGSDGKPHIIEVSLHGNRRYYSVSVVTITAMTSAHSLSNVGKLLHFTDITHFEELDRLKNDFLAKVSHEFRTPLTSIRMALDILIDKKIGTLNAEQTELVLSSKDDSERLTKLIRDLLAISGITSASISDEQIDIAEAAMKLVRALEPQFNAKQLLLKTDMISSLFAKISQDHFNSILQNLMVNALSYTPSGGQVTILLHPKDEHSWVLSVRDTGIGIPEADLGRIFEKFVQIKPRAAATPGSIGLGLAIVKELVELYHGKISVESKVGEGSVFTMTFPTTNSSV
ncbi:MAG TPA: ATP-binding protein [Candidatus Kapabacteria bacterium]|nr:ATP-binding protein [Candidatus Kapabacteria bacterium]